MGGARREAGGGRGGAKGGGAGEGAGAGRTEKDTPGPLARGGRLPEEEGEGMGCPSWGSRWGGGGRRLGRGQSSRNSVGLQAAKRSRSEARDTA